MSLKESLSNIKARIASVRDGLVQILKDKEVEISENASLSDVAQAVSQIKQGENVVLGQVDENGNFQPLKFDGTTATADGSAQSVDNYYTWNSKQ